MIRRLALAAAALVAASIVVSVAAVAFAVPDRSIGVTA